MRINARPIVAEGAVDTELKQSLPRLGTADSGADMHALMTDLFPICRSLTGPGFRETLEVLSRYVPIELNAVPSGTRCFDWTVPDEWSIRDAYLEDANGKRHAEFAENNLHVVGYSEPIDRRVGWDELNDHLHSLPEQPSAIPYVTSYYARTWGFCVSEEQRRRMPAGEYRVVVDSTLEPGVLNYGELLIPGESDEEILLSTYLCHPSMANNELSGPVLATFLARHILDLPQRRNSYRILFLPETIGAICYLSRHLDTMKERTIAGFVVTCVGGPDDFTYLASRSGDSLADRVALHVLNHCGKPYKRWDYTRRASDERQYCAPGVGLPVCSIMRSKYHDYPEYHTSLDDLNFVTPEQMQSSYELYVECLTTLELNGVYRTTTLCEPNLGSRGLYPTLGDRTHLDADVNEIVALLAYADGVHDIIDIADKHGNSATLYGPALKKLLDADLLVPAETTEC